jgi:hypothetical protein
LASLPTRLEADDSKAIHFPSGLIEAPRLSPLPSPPEPALMRTVDATDGDTPGSIGDPPDPADGGVGARPGSRVARNTSTRPFVSPSTRLAAAEE